MIKTATPNNIKHIIDPNDPNFNYLIMIVLEQKIEEAGTF